MIELNGDKVYIRYNEDKKEIFLSDKVDQANLPAEYNKTKRGMKKAWTVLKAAFRPDMTLYEAGKILTDQGIRMHYWCMVD